MKKLLLFLLFTYSSLAAQQTISLNQCFEAAERTHPLGIQNELSNQQLNNKLKELNRSFLPSLELGGKATWQSDVTYLPFEAPGFDVPKLSQDQYQATIDLKQKIWDANVSSSQKQIAQAQANLDRSQIAAKVYMVKEQVINFYYLALLASEQLAVNDIIYSNLNTQKTRVQNLVNNGAAIPSRVLEIEAKLIEVKQQKLKLEENKATSIQSLNLLTGLSIDKTTQFENKELGINSIGERPEFNLYKSQKILLDQQKELLAAKYKPQVFAFAKGGYGRPGLNLLLNEFKPYFLGGIQLSIPIAQWYNGAKKLDFQSITIQKAKIDSEIETFKRNLAIQELNQNTEVKNLKLMIETNKELIAIREKLTQTSQNQLENGIITNSDYINQLSDYETALKNQALYEIQLKMAYAKLQYIKGN